MNEQDAELVRQEETERQRILISGHGDIITEEDLEAWEKREPMQKEFQIA
jgi:hypothetical protein